MCITPRYISRTGKVNRYDMYRKYGFTLIELLVTISIAGILLAIAVPNFQTFMLNSRITTQANEFLTALNYARSEAVKRGVTVTVCPSSSGSACIASTDWAQGWIVFIDSDSNGLVAATSDVLRIWPALRAGSTLNAGITRTTFNSSGFARVGANNYGDTFRLCDSRGTALGREIELTNSGRTNISIGTTSCP